MLAIGPKVIAFNPNGILVASAGNDLSMIAAELKNSGTNGQTTLAAGHDLNLKTVTTAQINSQVWDARNHSQRNSSSEVGTSIQTSGDVTIIANHDLSVIGDRPRFSDDAPIS